MACNEKTETFGLSLTEQEAQELVVCRNESLKKYRRVEFGNGILDKLILHFVIRSILIRKTIRKRWKSCRIFSIVLKTKPRIS